MFSVLRSALIVQVLVLNSLTLSANAVFGADVVERVDDVRQLPGGLQLVVFDKGAVFVLRCGPQDDINAVFDWWIFPDLGYKKTGDTRTQKALLAITLSVQIEQTCEMFHLSEQHKRKLYLAGHGDIERLFDRLQSLRVRFRNSIEQGDDVKIEDRKLALELRESYRRLPFRQPDSIYSKVLHRTLMSEQLSLDPVHLLDQRRSLKAFEDLKLYEVCADLVEQYIADETPLRDKQQRIQLVEMLKRELHLTRIISRDHPELAWREMAELSQSAWKSRLDESQWETLNKKLQKFRGIAEEN